LLPGGGPPRELPVDHLATFLGDDLIDLLLARMGANVRIACAGFLPMSDCCR
jgi:hypothetical protein